MTGNRNTNKKERENATSNCDFEENHQQ